MKSVITVVGVVLFIGLGCGGRVTKDETPKRAAVDAADINAAITAVQNYPTPSGRTVLKKIALEITGYERAGRIVSFGGWMAEKETEYKYKVTCLAEVDGKNLWWVFYYYPSSGNVEPRRDFGRGKEVWR